MSTRINHALCAALLCLLAASCSPQATPPAALPSSKAAPAAISLQGRIAIPLTRNNAGLLVLSCIVNGVPARLVLDTGAGGSVFEIASRERLKMAIGETGGDATGAGGKVEMKASSGNSLQIGEWKRSRFDTVVLPLDHVNQAFAAVGDAPVDGVLGADVLAPTDAVIDYDSLTLYLKPDPQEANKAP